MIVTRKIALRIALIVLVSVILQAAFLSHLSILGAAPNVLPVSVVALGLLGGGVVGAVCGFATGFLTDSLLLQTLGVSSLVLLSIGYLAGRYRENFEPAGGGVPAMLAGGFTLLASAGFAALQLMLGVDSAVSLLVVREIVVQSILAVGLALALYPLIRKILAPALIDYTPSRSRIRLPAFAARRQTERPERTRTKHAAPLHGSSRVRAPRAPRPRRARAGITELLP